MNIARKRELASAALGNTALVSTPLVADEGRNRAYPDRSIYPSICQGICAGMPVVGGGQVREAMSARFDFLAGGDPAGVLFGQACISSSAATEETSVSSSPGHAVR
jgi:hypothetical protein